MANKPTTFKIPGTDVELPQWALIAGAGGVVAVLLFMKGEKEDPSRPGILERVTPTPTPGTDPLPPIIPDIPNGLPSPDAPAPSTPIPSIPKVPQKDTPTTPPVVLEIPSGPFIPQDPVVKTPQGPGLYKRPESAAVIPADIYPRELLLARLRKIFALRTDPPKVVRRKTSRSVRARKKVKTAQRSRTRRKKATPSQRRKLGTRGRRRR